jgi:hypothetical protein
MNPVAITVLGLNVKNNKIVMDFKDTINQLATRVLQLKENILTEEATKNAFIMPFINALGYDVFNPLEVIPEMDCDLIKKKGEKIDYAIIKNGQPILLIECKHWKQDLNLHDSQLQKYFVASKSKFGILTNGIVYRFYTDLINQNIMDEKPFFEINITELKDFQIEELKKFHKSYFDIENILSSASELKYTGELKALFAQEFSNPSPDFVKYFAKQVYDSIITSKVLDQFTVLIKRSVSNYVSDLISDRLKTALKTEEEADVEQANRQEETTKKTESVNTIETTEEEIEGYLIVKAIVRPVVDISRVVYRDAQTYCAVLLDDNNRKPICRLYFNRAKKYIAVFDDERKEVKYEISSLNDIYNYSEAICRIISIYDENK